MLENKLPDDKPAGFNAWHIGNYQTLLGNIIEVAEIAIDEEESRKEAEHQRDEAQNHLRYDELTHALTEYGLAERLHKLKNPKGILLLDGTNTKAANDNWGRQAGNEAIKTIYFCALSSVRPSDLIVRLNRAGDEFLIVLDGDETKPDNSEMFAIEERRQEYENTLSHLHEVKVSIVSRMQEVRSRYPELAEINLDVAVGISVWDTSKSLDQIIDEAEIDMHTHKDDQHKNGQHRAA